MIMRTHKIKLNPTPTQKRLLTQHAAYARAAYNWALRCYKDGKAAGQEPTQDALHRGPDLGKCRGAETDPLPLFPAIRISLPSVRKFR